MAHQQGGPVLRTQAQGGNRRQQKVHQLGVGGGGEQAEQLHTALQLLAHPLASRRRDGAAEGAATGPQAQRTGAIRHASAGGAGNRRGEFRPQTERFIRHQPHQLPFVDRAARLQGVETLDRGRRDLLVPPEAIHLRQQIAQAAIAIHLAGVQVTDTGGGLQGHGKRGDSRTPAA